MLYWHSLLPRARPLYAGSRARIIRFIRKDEEENDALVKCTCGQYQISYRESQVISIDLDNPYMKEDHYDLLLPAALTEDTWNRISKCLTNW